MSGGAARVATVELRGVSKRFGNVTAVDDVSLTVADGEFLVLVGPSGSGKSTLLRLVAGLEELSEGAISIDGNDVSHLAPKDRDVAMVFQNYALYPHMSVADNMAFGLRMRGYARNEIDHRVREVAQMLGLSELLGRRPRDLSGGEQQRVALGRAVVRNPKVFLMDEPLSSLDAQLRVQMRTELKRLHQRLRTTTIYVTHDQVEAMTMGDRVAVMRNGRILQAAPPRVVYEQPANLFVAEFIGLPRINLVQGRLEPRDGQLRFRTESLAITLPSPLAEAASHLVGRPVVLGVRPEDLLVEPNGARSNSGPRLDAYVEVVEPVGAETFVTVVLG
ncbi:MAG: ABC transporter ATP-binding protein, partial [Clostridia bacterium]|nr:ABC transporter ATP-binding protein [Clostridia bacterium]